MTEEEIKQRGEGRRRIYYTIHSISAFGINTDGIWQSRPNIKVYGMVKGKVCEQGRKT